MLAVPSALQPIQLDPKVYDSYVGTYELAPDVRYTVKREGGRLMGQRSGREPEELFPKSETSFFLPGYRGEKIFVKDESGRVTRLVDRRDNNDLVWRRVG